MARNFGTARVSSVSPKLDSEASGHYIDLRFSRRTYSHDYRPSDFSGYDSEDFIDICFPQNPGGATYDSQVPVNKLHGLDAHTGAVNPDRNARAVAELEGEGVKSITAAIKEMRFPRVSDDTLKVDIEDFYTALTVGLDSLQRLADSAFLTAEFLEHSISLLQTVDNDVQILLEKLAELRNTSSVEFRQALAEYASVSGKILDVCNALKFTTTLLKAYQDSQVEAAVVTVEALVSLPGSAPRAVNVVQAKEAGHCIDSAGAEMVQMRTQVKKLVESGSYGSLLYFVPNLNLTNADSDLSKCSGLWGVLFALKTAGSYICQLLLAAFAYAGEGPALVASTNVASFNSGWAASLVCLHNHARKQFNKMKDSSRSSSSFMYRDSERLEFMLEDSKGHLQSLLDQGKFLNMGVYLGSWTSDKKKLMHNVPLLRQQLLIIRYRLSKLSEGLEYLASNIMEGQRFLGQL